jgi:hypothetical protein
MDYNLSTGGDFFMAKKGKRFAAIVSVKQESG